MSKNWHLSGSMIIKNKKLPSFNTIKGVFGEGVDVFFVAKLLPFFFFLSLFASEILKPYKKVSTSVIFTIIFTCLKPDSYFPINIHVLNKYINKYCSTAN